MTCACEILQIQIACAGAYMYGFVPHVVALKAKFVHDVDLVRDM